MMTRFIIGLLLITCLASAFADDSSGNNSSQNQGPQIAPNIVIQPDQQTQALIGKLFDNHASYQYFHSYDKVILFKIPTLNP